MQTISEDRVFRNSEQERTCAADAAGADTDPDGNGKRRSENRILHGMDETAGHGVGSYG